jgi:hypothetical protein
MKIRHANIYRHTNNFASMKGVSDTIYLAFVSILIIGGSYYIYNDINAAKPLEIISSDASLSEVNNTPSTPLLEQKQQPITVEAKKNEITIIENQQAAEPQPVVETQVAVPPAPVVEIQAVETPAVETQVVETPAVAPLETALSEQKNQQQSPISQTKVIEKVAVENKPTATIVDSSSLKSSEDKADSKTTQEKATTEETTTKTNTLTNNLDSSPQPVTENNVNPAARYNRMPMPNMQRMVPPRYNYPMNQAAEYMPHPYMQNPYYGGNQGYRGNAYPQNYKNPNNQPYQQRGQQRGQQENYQQQGGQYRNTNRPYPEQYTPWNPGRFY